MSIGGTKTVEISALKDSMTEIYLVRAKHVGVVVEVTKCGESMFVFLELDKAIT